MSSSTPASEPPESSGAPSLLDIYLALAHIGAASGPLAPLPGEAPEETPRLHITHAATGEWRVFVRPDLPPTLRQRLAALPPAFLFTEHARVAELLAQGEGRHAVPSGYLGDDLWIGRTLLFPECLAPDLPSRIARAVVRLEPTESGTPGADFYGSPAPASARLRPAIAAADEAAHAREVFPGAQFAVIEDDVVVATCESSRESALAAEAWVRTLPASRGRGYATLVTAAWALDVRRRGKAPFYSHHRDNAASAGVARALGLLPFLDDVGYL